MGRSVEPVAASSLSEAAVHAEGVRTHLRSILESAAFKGSRRSQEFLQFVVDRALKGRLDDLKERVLGVELFHRPPSYDTGDAIVRVTASDVRQRLHRFYGETDRDEADYRIGLPTGSYVPEIHCPAAVAEVRIAERTIVAAKEIPATRSRWNWKPATALAAIGIATLGIWEFRPANSPVRALPFSAMIQTNRPIRLILCDPDIVNIQRLLNYSVSLSDYANQKYWPTHMDRDAARTFQSMSFRGASVAAVDASLAVKIGELLYSAAKREVQVQTARNTRLADFKAEDNFVLFGSPRSNPWVELFEDQLDFTFEFDPVRKSEFIRNRRPHNGESLVYLPTAEGWETGQAYGIVALVSNPQQNGHVLLLAGSNAEATEAAGKLALNQEALTAVLRKAAVDAAGPFKRFEVLLRVFTMAGSPNTSEVVACHLLGGAGRVD